MAKAKKRRVLVAVPDELTPNEVRAICEKALQEALTKRS